MGMYAVSANELKVHFNKDTFLTFKMHADLNMDLLRWLQAQTKRLEVVGKRADRIEKTAVDLALEDSDRFVQLTEEAESLRNKGGDTLDIIVEYVKRACKGWTDYYEDADAEARQQLLPFDETNIARIGIAKLGKVVQAFNVHYGILEPESGEANAESSPAPSLPADKVLGATPSGITSSAPTA